MTVYPPSGNGKYASFALWHHNPDDARREKQVQFEEEALPHTDSLYRYAIRLARDHALAEDLVQETLLKAWCSWPTYRRGSDIRAWLATILRHTFFRQRRAEQRAFQNAILHRLEFPSPQSAGRSTELPIASFRNSVDPELMRTVNDLPREFRQVVALRHFGGLSVARIAEVTGTPVGTVKSRLFRAHETLRERLYRHAAAAGFLRGRRRRSRAPRSGFGSGSLDRELVRGD